MPPVGFEPTISADERPAAAHLLRSWVRIPPVAWIFVCCECRVLSGRGLCDELITRPEDSYRPLCTGQNGNASQVARHHVKYLEFWGSEGNLK